MGVQLMAPRTFVVALLLAAFAVSCSSSGRPGGLPDPSGGLDVPADAMIGDTQLSNHLSFVSDSGGYGMQAGGQTLQSAQRTRVFANDSGDKLWVVLSRFRSAADVDAAMATFRTIGAASDAPELGTHGFIAVASKGAHESTVAAGNVCVFTVFVDARFASPQPDLSSAAAQQELAQARKLCPVEPGSDLEAGPSFDVSSANR
jgi:hypothetical protein